MRMGWRKRWEMLWRWMVGGFSSLKGRLIYGEMGVTSYFLLRIMTSRLLSGLIL